MPEPSSTTPVPVLTPAADVLSRPVSILVGHFGSGKTEIAVNLAFRLRERGDDVTLIDLDVVKPYFRSRLAIDELEARGIELVAPRGEHFQADLPIVVRDVRASIGQAVAGRRRVIIDAGGAEVGARVLGSVAGLSDPAVCEMLFVVNGNRPFAETPEAIVQMLRQIEEVSRLRVTGLIANTHLMDETTVAIVREGIHLAAEVGRLTGIPLVACTVRADLIESLRVAEGNGVPLLSIERHIMPPLNLRPAGTRRRSSVV
jgi:hypothetical protein